MDTNPYACEHFHSTPSGIRMYEYTNDNPGGGYTVLDCVGAPEHLVHQIAGALNTAYGAGLTTPQGESRAAFDPHLFTTRQEEDGAYAITWNRQGRAVRLLVGIASATLATEVSGELNRTHHRARRADDFHLPCITCGARPDSPCEFGCTSTHGGWWMSQRPEHAAQAIG